MNSMPRSSKHLGVRAFFAGLCLLAMLLPGLCAALDSVTVNRTGPNLDEASPAVTSSLYVRLTSQPTAGQVVVLDLSSDTTLGVTLSASTLTFTNANWNQYQIVTVTPVDDAVVEVPLHASLINLTVNAAATTFDAYDAVIIPAQTVWILDNDTQTTVYRTGPTLDEGNVALTQTMYTRINTQPPPGQFVFVALNSDTAQGVTLSAPFLVFDNSNWKTLQPITITVVNDAVLEPALHASLVTLTVNAGITNFDAFDFAPFPTQTIYIKDDDQPVSVYRTGPNLDESNLATTQSMFVRINTQPTAGQVVVIDLSSDTVQGVTLSTPTLTFTNANWNVFQTVTVAAVNDAVVEAPIHASTINLAVNPVATTFDSFDAVSVPSQTVWISDNDTPVSVYRTGPSPDENNPSATQTMYVRISTQPTAGQVVVIDLGSDTAQGVTLSTPSLTFTNANWNQFQTVTITPVDDAVVEPPVHSTAITLTVNAAATTFDAFDAVTVPPQILWIADNDTPVTVYRTGPVLDESDVGATQKLYVRINSQPNPGEEVVIDLGSDTAQGLSLSASTLTFNDANWSQFQIVTLTVVNDGVIEAPVHSSLLTLTVNAAATTFDAFDATVIPAELVWIRDDDQPVSVYRTGPSLDESNLGATQTMFVRINAQPNPGEAVVIDLGSDTVQGVTLSTPTLTFTPANWNVFQPVTITTVDDAVVEAANHLTAITLTINAGSTTFDAYDSVTVPSQNVWITDNDSPFTVYRVGLALDESNPAATQKMYVRVNTQPNPGEEVVLNLGSDTALGLTLSVPTLTFTSANWNLFQIVTLTVVDDTTVEAAAHLSLVTLTIDPVATTFDAFDAVTLPDQRVYIYDNDHTLTALPAAPSFSYVQGDANPASQAIAIARVGNGTAQWSLTSDQLWLTTDVASGSTASVSSPVVVSVDPTGLSVGVYTGHLTVTDPVASNSPRTVTVTLTVLPPVPAIALSQTALTFAGEVGQADPADQTSDLSNTGATDSTLHWEVTTDHGWLSCSPGSGVTTTGTDTLTIHVTPHMPDHWASSLTTTDAPAGRYDHSAVWTGTEMIIWGGIKHLPTLDDATNDGGRYDPATDTWSTTAIDSAGAPTPRSGHCAVWTSSRMIVWGGAANTWFNDGSAYDPLNNTWTPISNTDAPSARQWCSAVWTGTEMIVWGGRGAGYVPLDNGARYDPATDTWSSMAAAPVGRYGHQAVWTGTQMIIWGGLDSIDGETNSGYAYDPATDTWSATPINATGAPLPRENFSAVYTGTEMIVWGGSSNYVAGTHARNGGKYDPSTDTWTAATPSLNAPAARRYHTGIWTGSEMIIWGGEALSGALLDTGTRFRLASDLSRGSYTGTVTISDPYAANNPQTIDVSFDYIQPDISLTNTYMYFSQLAGAADPAPQYSDLTNVGDAGSTAHWTATSNAPFLQVSPSSGTTPFGPDSLTVSVISVLPEEWNGTISSTDELSARAGAATAYSDNWGTFIWGGYDASVMADGSVYDEILDAWYPVTSTDAPEARGWVTAVWTGTKFLVWGGRGASNDLNDGAMYDPASDTWSPISSVNAPSPRFGHSAVWTGSTMIVWGGLDSSLNALDDGGMYDPATDTWTPIGGWAGFAPVARGFHSAVWTGDHMIVWGGLDASLSDIDTGASYDPLTDTWAAISQVNAPAPRDDHRAIWTGQKMLVWGAIFVDQNVYAYDPATDTWTSSAPANPPTARYGNVAVWTGVEMFVWGGIDSSTLTAIKEGTFYDPPLQLPSGYYSAYITVEDPNGINPTSYIDVDYEILDPVPTIDLTASTLAFTAPEGGPDPAAQTVDLSNVGEPGSVLLWTATTDAGWLNVSPASGTTYTGPDTLTVTALGTIDSWCGPLSTTDAPEDLGYFSSVYTSSQMIIWGGTDADGCTNAGYFYDNATDTWSTTLTTTVDAPSPRDSHSAVWTGSQMIIWGGLDDGYNALGDGAMYDPATDTWTPISSVNAPSPRFAHSAVWTGTCMIVWGGFDYAAGGFDDGGMYDPSTDTWTPLDTTNAPSARFSHSAIWTGTEMIVWGGISDATGSDLNSGGRFDPATGWSATPLSTVGAPPGRDSHSAVWTGDHMIIWGGYNDAYPGGQPYSNDGAYYDPATDTWDRLTTTLDAATARYSHAAYFDGSEMVIWGGFDSSGDFVNTGKRYMLPAPLAAGVYTAQITISDPYASNDAQVIDVTFTVQGPQPSIDLSSNALSFWSQSGGSDDLPQTVDLTNAGPSGTTLNWTATANIPWLSVSPNSGTTTTGTDTLTIQTYMLQAEQWFAPTTLTDAPDSRYGHSAVWTGTEMIVWGGSDGGTAMTGGGRYSLTSDSWSTTPISSTDAPSGRFFHTAVWTGSKMIVWGGFADGGVLLNDGAMYDPATDTWSAISTTDAPSARYGHTAVWTGDRMIVWGGIDQFDLDTFATLSTATGASYDPSTDTWSPIDTTNSPTARNSHTAVWAGDKMIVWGGVDDSGTPLQSGSIYDPSIDTWSTTPVETTGAPSARFGHVAVWTGSKMIVWGGLDDTFNLTDTGALYDPATNTWTTATTTTGAPEASSYNTAVWTGTDMLVWGGVCDEPLQDGKRYLPEGDLAPGTYTGQITVSDPAADNDAQTITVTLTVAP